MKKIVLIASNYMDLKISSNNRTNYLPQFLHNKGYDVEVVTSDFNHHKKEHVTEVEKRDYKFTVLHELGYKKNVSIKRILSIYVYKKNLKKYLRGIKQADYVLTFVPPHSIARVACKFAKKIGAKLIIDIRDLWPEAFKIIIRNNFLYKLLFFPLIIQANLSYKSADTLTAVSATYINRGLKSNNKANYKVIYIGTSIAEFDKFVSDRIIINKPTDEIWAAYAGTLGNSYDLDTVFQAFEIVKLDNNPKIVLHILGSGPKFNELVAKAKKMEINCVFHGRISYPEMVAFLSYCDIVLNPLVKNAPQSIINKHADYAAAGLPVISTQETEEYVNLINDKNIGFNVKCGDSQDFARKLQILAKNEHLRKLMGLNHRNVAETLFDRDIIYNAFLDVF